jgi:polysaccharide deacetylase 2 family uncharacterized protein YibQ
VTRSRSLASRGALLAALPFIAAFAFAQPPRIAIVVDDLGYSRASGLRAISLPGHVTFGVLPFTPHASELADRAIARDADVIVHQPMESLGGPTGASVGVLTTAMPRATFRTAFTEALDTLPQAMGVSNHTGSLLTARRLQMGWLMAELRRRGLFFIDSRTTADTVAESAALAAGIPVIRRDVFLDHVLDDGAIAASFERALKIAHAQGHALLIAHPHAASLAFLEAGLPTLPERGVRQVRLAELLSAP